jgi:hypothetical protein
MVLFNVPYRAPLSRTQASGRLRGNRAGLPALAVGGEQRREDMVKHGAGTGDRLGGGPLGGATRAPGRSGDPVTLDLAADLGDPGVGDLVLEVGVHHDLSSGVVR